MKQTVFVEFWHDNEGMDIEVPLNITGDELVHALNEGIGLGINEMDKSSFNFTANDIEIIGSKTIEQLGILDGYIIKYTDI